MACCRSGDRASRVAIVWGELMARVLKIHPAPDDDETLTCFVCGELKCDLVFAARPAYPRGGHKGTRYWIGLHSYCAEASGWAES